MSYSNQQKSILQALGIDVFEPYSDRNTAITESEPEIIHENQQLSQATDANANAASEERAEKEDREQKRDSNTSVIAGQQASDRLQAIREQFDDTPASTKSADDLSDNSVKHQAEELDQTIQAPDYAWLPAMKVALGLKDEQVVFTEVSLPNINGDILEIPLHWPQPEHALKKHIWMAFIAKHPITTS